MGEALTVRDDGIVKFTATAALASGQVIRLASSLAAVVLGLSAIAIGDVAAVAILGPFDLAAASGTVFSDGEEVWWDDTNNLAVRAGASTATFRAGLAIRAKVSGETVVRVELNAAPGMASKHVATAVSSAVSNTTTETVVGTYSIPANAIKQGAIIEFMAALIATATNGTDTFRFRVRLGGLAGTVVADTTAVDLANNDIGVLRGEIVFRSDGATGAFVGASQSILKTTASPTGVTGTLDTTAATTVVVTIEESVASASNSARCESFTARLR